MRVVSNTSPLLNLAITKRLELLRVQFGVVTIPSSVHKELQLDEDLPGVPDLLRSLHDGWLAVIPDKDDMLQHSLSSELDCGEAAAISLAVSLKADLILLDDRDARHTAALMGIKVTGVVGVILRAKSMGLVVSVAEELAHLRKEAGFRIGDAIMADALEVAGESSQS